MKTLLIALNSKYIHSSLAIWYLKATCDDVQVMEFTINDNIDSILADIYSEKPDVVAFSCYIWNISHVLKLVDDLKKVSPNTKIILGGPEVSFDPIQIMTDNSSIDYIISGEGEHTLRLLLDFNIEPKEIDGLTYRQDDTIIQSNPCKLIQNLHTIPSPYTDEMLTATKDRIVYFESSRGCPFSCSYCISSTFEGVRYFPMERVLNDLKKLIDAQVRQIKFVDRTFNCNKARAKGIFKFIIDNHCNTNFHFEAAADLFDDEMLEILSTAPTGLIQLEIGIQTTNTRTFEAIDRKTSLDKVFQNIEKLRRQNNIHIHLDLIAGLPYEDYSSFKNSFNDVYALKPHHLQLGFLKMLKGSKIRQEAELHSYIFRSRPTYEILHNKYISFDEMLELKGIEEILERYYNSGRFIQSLEFMLNTFLSPFDFYRQLYLFSKSRGYLERPLSSRENYTVLIEFAKSVIPSNKLRLLNELLKLDFLSSDNSNNIPGEIIREISHGFREWCFEFLKNEENINRFLPQFVGIPAKQIIKQVHFEEFEYDVMSKNPKEKKTVVLFDYTYKDKVTGLYRCCSLPNKES